MELPIVEKCWLNASAIDSGSLTLSLFILKCVVGIPVDLLVILFILLQNCFGFLKSEDKQSL